MKSTSSTVTCGSLVMIALASLVVLEITSSFTEAYPSYSGYYSPMGYEEPNPYQIPNLEQAIMRLRAAFADNNELENKNNIGLSMVELLELTREAFDLWLKHYQEKLVEADALVEGQPQSPQTKRSQLAELRGSRIDRFSLDGTLKRTADFGSDRGHTGQKEYALRTISTRSRPSEKKSVIADFGTEGQREAANIVNKILGHNKLLQDVGK
ncbi:uncharacterized protein LOC126748008 [Anthonomus grandis grandis]|uniref:uncharacterized protein LOC126748008 n=1 Tax=Anthonomus grandis grandis TaxID=2921223 RepID=UPI002165AC8C|nr:uncharacterized protein LOC126748008 [Anthonomus grandis grandis]